MCNPNCCNWNMGRQQSIEQKEELNRQYAALTDQSRKSGITQSERNAINAQRSQISRDVAKLDEQIAGLEQSIARYEQRITDASAPAQNAAPPPRPNANAPRPPVQNIKPIPPMQAPSAPTPAAAVAPAANGASTTPRKAPTPPPPLAANRTNPPNAPSPNVPAPQPTPAPQPSNAPAQQPPVSPQSSSAVPAGSPSQARKYPPPLNRGVQSITPASRKASLMGELARNRQVRDQNQQQYLDLHVEHSKKTEKLKQLEASEAPPVERARLQNELQDILEQMKTSGKRLEEYQKRVDTQEDAIAKMEHDEKFPLPADSLPPDQRRNIIREHQSHYESEWREQIQESQRLEDQYRELIRASSAETEPAAHSRIWDKMSDVEMQMHNTEKDIRRKEAQMSEYERTLATIPDAPRATKKLTVSQRVTQIRKAQTENKLTLDAKMKEWGQRVQERSRISKTLSEPERTNVRDELEEKNAKLWKEIETLERSDRKYKDQILELSNPANDTVMGKLKRWMPW